MSLFQIHDHSCGLAFRSFTISELWMRDCKPGFDMSDVGSIE